MRRRRIVAAMAFVIVVAVVGAVAVAGLRRHHHAAPPPPPPPPKPFRVVFPEGFTRVQMGQRVQAVARIAEKERHGRVRLGGAAYLAATGSAVIPCFGPKRQTNLEGFLFPATYDFLAGTTSKQLARDQLKTFCKRWRKVDLSYARSKNLTPYDVLTIASMIEREAAVPSERPLIAAVIYNRLHDHMQLGIDATLRYGLHIPPT
ncbi:MAG TPA: endolytic transglycosylase MltG, partial [Gaiellaceae bacterium]